MMSDNFGLTGVKITWLSNGQPLARSYSVFDRFWRQEHYYQPDLLEYRITVVTRKFHYARSLSRVFWKHQKMARWFDCHPRCFSRPDNYDTIEWYLTEVQAAERGELTAIDLLIESGWDYDDIEADTE